jgi:hypothetical protein
MSAASAPTRHPNAQMTRRRAAAMSAGSSRARQVIERSVAGPRLASRWAAAFPTGVAL